MIHRFPRFCLLWRRCWYLRVSEPYHGHGWSVRFVSGQLAILDVCAAFSSGITMVSLALWGYEVWSLVWAFVVRHAILGLGPWIFCPFNPVRSFNAVDVRVLFGFGGKWTGSRLVGYVQQNLDYLLIGRFLGIEALGYYGLAYRLIAFPQTRVVQAVAKVTFPAFSALQDDVDRLGRAYLSTVKYVAILVFSDYGGIFPSGASRARIAV